MPRAINARFQRPLLTGAKADTQKPSCVAHQDQPTLKRSSWNSPKKSRGGHTASQGTQLKGQRVVGGIERETRRNQSRNDSHTELLPLLLKTSFEAFSVALENKS